MRWSCTLVLVLISLALPASQGIDDDRSFTIENVTYFVARLPPHEAGYTFEGVRKTCQKLWGADVPEIKNNFTERIVRHYKQKLQYVPTVFARTIDQSRTPSELHCVQYHDPFCTKFLRYSCQTTTSMSISKDYHVGFGCYSDPDSSSDYKNLRKLDFKIPEYRLPTTWMKYLLEKLQYKIKNLDRDEIKRIVDQVYSYGNYRWRMPTDWPSEFDQHPPEEMPPYQLRYSDVNQSVDFLACQLDESMNIPKFDVQVTIRKKNTTKTCISGITELVCEVDVSNLLKGYVVYISFSDNKFDVNSDQWSNKPSITTSAVLGYKSYVCTAVVVEQNSGYEVVTTRGRNSTIIECLTAETTAVAADGRLQRLETQLNKTVKTLQTEIEQVNSANSRLALIAVGLAGAALLLALVLLILVLFCLMKARGEERKRDKESTIKLEDQELREENPMVQSYWAAKEAKVSKESKKEVKLETNGTSSNHSGTGSKPKDGNYDPVLSQQSKPSMRTILPAKAPSPSSRWKSHHRRSGESAMSACKETSITAHQAAPSAAHDTSGARAVQLLYKQQVKPK